MWVWVHARFLGRRYVHSPPPPSPPHTHIHRERFYPRMPCAYCILEPSCPTTLPSLRRPLCGSGKLHPYESTALVGKRDAVPHNCGCRAACALVRVKTSLKTHVPFKNSQACLLCILCPGRLCKAAFWNQTVLA